MQTIVVGTVPSSGKPYDLIVFGAAGLVTLVIVFFIKRRQR